MENVARIPKDDDILTLEEALELIDLLRGQKILLEEQEEILKERKDLLDEKANLQEIQGVTETDAKAKDTKYTKLLELIQKNNESVKQIEEMNESLKIEIKEKEADIDAMVKVDSLDLVQDADEIMKEALDLNDLLIEQKNLLNKEIKLLRKGSTLITIDSLKKKLKDK
eukprot:CAMPEP_0194131736 /NCGR_PEP_ID=MMETSP0152-20130528/2435_1 /TAXON_ID=1049557 /ORGANISM="Thalassiothrix antarctica, Strain L6-D1" /LENGTH=168 /DNA_ID=CAMNT_0038826607 /DNA_START=207 /DNA_END=710 /DNA_ORIENTATION=+